MPKEVQESELLTAAMDGDTAALERLLLANYSRLEKHIAPRIPDSIQRYIGTEDVLQEVFTQAFRDISRYEVRSGTSFLIWLKTIADHRLVDVLRRIRAKKRGGQFRQLTPNDMELQSTVAQLIDLIWQSNATASKSVARSEAASAVNVGIASLPVDQRTAILAKYFEGKNVDVIAEEMNRSPGAVRGLIHRAQKSLADMMGRSSQWLSR